ncbi:WGR and DUF4132 domain-containing protein [Burkholderia ubonensis]|uniref:WGR and DUF4132 domain-containing protein n=1 Tax=Burkholderia ubonensis TaxID=101571 RepID=UPI0007523BF5|nr:DUF4132 domain-containing protein [Burkholderia ubonensis]AOI73408.1 polymerase [Burkholderia ubonensis]KUZ22067.1 polymerase [Burkholderia ubonensis]KUZ28446.1 polymerase [Burkholderia ubonensis]KUZ39849.1 polymerase [Burkholderia ubonensis]KUZ48990.1 polymerase [Burkholderia ubonensis]
MRRFELIEGNSSKFWEVEQDGSGLNIRWGRIGTAGQSQTKSFADDAKARAALDKLVKEKAGKGYAEVAVAAGAGIGATAAKPPSAAPSADAAAGAQPATVNAANGVPAATAAASAPASTDSSAPAPVPPAAAEGFDAQCERVFETVRAQIANGDMKPGETLTVAVIKRRYDVSDQGAAMAFDLLKSRRLLYGWGTSADVHEHAQATAAALGEWAASEAAAVAPEPAAPAVADAGTPPWLMHGDPVRMSPQIQRVAYASRRFPVAVNVLDVRAAWLKIEGKNGYSIDMSATDAALRPAVQRMLDRLAARTPIAGPAADAEADAALFALALTLGDYHGETAIGRPVADYLVAQYGLIGAIDVLLDALKIQVHADYDRQAQRRVQRFSTNVDGPVRASWRGPIAGGEETLREHLAAASDADWQACVDRIEAGLPALHPSRQPVPALLLPDTPDLSNALVRRLGAGRDVPETLHWMLLTATDPDAIAVAAKIRPDSYGHTFWGMERMAATVLRERGAAAFDVLERGAADDAAGDALAAIGTPDAVTALAKVASGSKGALARLSLSLDRWPVAGMVALSRLVAAGGKDAGLLTPSLTRLLRAHTAHVDVLRPWLDAPAQAVIDKLLALLAGPVDVASTDELPDVLAAPPWLAARQKKTAALTLEPLELAAIECWDEAKRNQAKTPDQWEAKRLAAAAKDTMALIDGLGFDASKKYYGPLGEAAARAIRQGDAPAFVDAWRAMLDERKRERYFWYWLRAEYLTLLPAGVAVDIWNAVAGEHSTGSVDMLMATFGLPALPGLIATVRNKPTENFHYALNYGAVECAPIAARAFAKLKTLRDDGRAWLLKFPEHAASGLIAPALGKPGEARDCAGAALRLLQANGHEALLMDVAARYADDAAPQAVRAVLDESPLDRFPTKRGKLPEFWQPRGWRRPVLKNGKALPDEALDHFGQMLTFPTNEGVYGGIDVVKDTCTAESLADFAWDCFNAWLDAGAPGKEGWALTALGLFGNDDTARKLTPLIRTWPGESAHARAATGLDVLASIGSDVALMLLNGIAQKVKFRALQDRAREKIDAIADARGLSSEELEDRLAPDLGLDAQGTMLLDFGPRAFRVGFDETLKPYVRETGADGVPGARLADLPKPKKTDDPVKGREAVERFKLLKKDARTIASQQLARLEVAMCGRRRWAPDVFRAFLAEHPLVRHLVQRLVWGVYEVDDGGNFGGTLKACFRVAEDGTAATADDDVFTLPEGETIRIGVPHALEIEPADAAAFGQVFADYELLQPFAQLGRDVYRLTDDERNGLLLERWKGVKVPTGRVLGLVNKGWRRGEAQDAGCIWYFTKPLGAGKVIELSLDPGIIVGSVDMYPEQALGALQTGSPSNWGGVREPDALSTLDEISASELIRDLERMRE